MMLGVEGIGSVNIAQLGVLKHVLHVPRLCVSLLSVQS